MTTICLYAKTHCADVAFVIVLILTENHRVHTCRFNGFARNVIEEENRKQHTFTVNVVTCTEC